MSGTSSLAYKTQNVAEDVAENEEQKKLRLNKTLAGPTGALVLDGVRVE